MKKYMKITLGLLVAVALVIQNCTKEKELNLNLTAIPGLDGPADNTFIQLKPSNLTTGQVVFQWKQSLAEDGSLVLYDVVFDQVGGDFSKPFFIIPSDQRGIQPQLTVPYSTINDIAKAGGLDFFQRKKFIWSARASKGSNIKVALQALTIDIQRPGGFNASDIPTTLFLTGTATEGGTNLANAVPMVNLAPGVFEIYTRLVPGSYQMVNATSGTPKSYSVTLQDGANVLISGGTTNFAGTAGVYRFRVNFGTISATTPLAINKVGLWLCARGDTLPARMKYQTRGLWQGNTTVTLVDFGWGIDDRYKYRLYLGDGSVEFWGYQGNDSPGQDGKYPNGFAPTYNNAFSNGPADNQWDYSWKFDKPAVNGKNVTFSLRFQPPAYSNQYVVN